MRFSLFSKFIAPLIYLFVTPARAFAADPVNVTPCPPSGPFAALCTISSGNFGKVLGNFITALMVLAALISLFFLIYGGIKWITSEGDKTAVETARQTIIGAIIGLVVVFLSYLILSIVLGLFGIQLSQLTIPNITLTQ